MSKLLFVKWISLVMSVGFIAFFIISDIYQDNEEYQIPIKVQEEVAEETETSSEPIESTNTVATEVIDESSLVTCEDFINAYNAQITSDNNKISQSILDKYNECMEMEEAESETKLKPVKEDKISKKNK